MTSLKPMSRSRRLVVLIVALIAAAVALSSIAEAASPSSKRSKRHPTRHWHGYGFLPGYPPARDYRPFGPRYWYGGPGFYRGRWNGGGFGPCWTPTPIGPFWNCG